MFRILWSFIRKQGPAGKRFQPRERSRSTRLVQLDIYRWQWFFYRIKNRFKHWILWFWSLDSKFSIHNGGSVTFFRLNLWLFKQVPVCLSITATIHCSYASESGELDPVDILHTIIATYRMILYLVILIQIWVVLCAWKMKIILLIHTCDVLIIYYIYIKYVIMGEV